MTSERPRAQGLLYLWKGRSLARCPPRRMHRRAYLPRNRAAGSGMSFVVWIAFGLIAGYTVVGMVPVDEELGTRGHMALGSAAALVGGLVGSLLLGVDPFSMHVNMFSVVTALIGAVIAIVGWNQRRGPLARGRGF